MTNVETRLCSQGIELRRTDSHHVEFRGYASVSNVAYNVAGGPTLGGWSETIQRGAWTDSLTEGRNLALLYAHDNAKVAATTRAGTLTVTEDDIGLAVRANLNTRVQWLADLAAQIEDGTIDEMSVGFYVPPGGSQWSAGYDERTITRARLVEATIVWAGANGATFATVNRNAANPVALRAAAARLRLAG